MFAAKNKYERKGPIPEVRRVGLFFCVLGASECNLTHSTAPSPVFEDGVEKRRSGSTLSKPKPSGWGVEGLT